MNDQPEATNKGSWRAEYMLTPMPPPPPEYTVVPPGWDEPFRLRLADLPYDEPDDSVAAEEG